jgi:hypothetical protein
MNRETERKIDDVKEAFGVECYWSMAGVFCIEAVNADGRREHIALKPEPGGIWDNLSAAATAMLDERAKIAA